MPFLYLKQPLGERLFCRIDISVPSVKLLFIPLLAGGKPQEWRRTVVGTSVYVDFEYEADRYASFEILF